MPNFQRNLHSIQLRTEGFFNTHWLILFVPMRLTHFQSQQIAKKPWKVITNFSKFLRKIVRRHANFSA